MSEKYNGWTNYATWRINLEVFDNIPLADFDFEGTTPDLDQLSDALQERLEYYIECTSEPGIARDYALAFLSDVNYREIAKHMLDEYANA